MNTKSRLSVGLAIAAIAATVGTLAITGEKEGQLLEPTVDGAYAKLGPGGLIPLALELDLRSWKIRKVNHGREVAIGSAPIAATNGDSYHVIVERLTDREGERTTVLTVELRRQTGTDAILLPWHVTKVIPNDDVVFSPDFDRMALDTAVCDERDGKTTRLVVAWRTKGDVIDVSTQGMILDGRTGDATMSGRFGTDMFAGGHASLARQLVSRPLEVRDPELRIEGRRVKPVRCAAPSGA